MKKLFKKAWNYINGHKTVIFMSSAALMQQAVNHDLINDSKGVGFAITILSLLGGGSLAHHVKKGFKKKKN